MSKAKRPEPQPWLKYIVLPLLLIIFGLLVSALVLPKTVIAPSDGLLTPTPTPTPPEFICPSTGWASCMPILTPEAAKNCSNKAITWFKKNCPNFQGVAY